MKKKWRVVLDEQQRAVIILMTERFEGKRSEFQRMDRALNGLDPSFILSDQIQTTGTGVMIDISSLHREPADWFLKNEPFKTLRTFLKDQVINYSRRKATVGRIFITVLDAFDDAEEIEEVSDES